MPQTLNIQNKVISASAGSGKTFQLALRYIGLIANDVPPEKIICLTFSKKAAGEIFDKIIQILFRWYENKDAMLKESQLAEIQPLTANEIASIISKLLLSINKLNISTLDSFFVNILKNFPFEYGLNSNFQIIDEYEQDITKYKILRDLLSSKSSKEEKNIIFEAFKQATFGQEEKKPFDKLRNFINDYHNLYICDSQKNHWGNEQLIWKNSNSLKKISQTELDTIIDEFRLLIAEKNLKSTQMEKFNEFLDEVKEFNIKFQFSEKTDYFFTKNIIPKLDQIKSGKTELTVNRSKVTLYEKECEALHNIIKFIFSTIIYKLSRQTRGIYKTLNLYEQKYETAIRRNGQLTFNDITLLLADDKKPQISSFQNNNNKLYIEYRLDSTYDHWMLDEFQDTNISQWNIISNLIDEILQDHTSNRSFFYVGDVKQSIYGWRGGDYYLFDYVYNLNKNKFANPEKLSTCYRSNKEIIDTVNNVFNNLSKIDKISSEVLQLWNKSWQSHKHSPFEKNTGYATLIEFPDSKTGKETKEIEILKILQKIEPLKRNLSVGILTLKNDTAKSIAAFLQQNNIPVSYDGSYSLNDCPTIAAIMSLIKYINHPGDNFAWEHIRMTPLYQHIKTNYPTRSAFITAELGFLYNHNYSKLIKKWVNIISGIITLKEFAIVRSKQLISAAETFDRSGNKNALDFVSFINSYKIPGNSVNNNNVQILTIHKSKGLEYDIVILPELKTKAVNRINNISTIQQKRSKNNTCDWTMYLPKRAIAGIDETLNLFIKELDNDHSYEGLCCLYVAMTRAKKALYMLAEKENQKSITLYPADILINTLKDKNNNTNSPIHVYETGDQDWYSKYRHITNTKTSAYNNYSLNFNLSTKPVSVAPSTADNKETGITDLLFPEIKDHILVGNCIHYLFEQITWLHEFHLNLPALKNRIKREYPENIVNESISLFENILSKKELAYLFKKPTPHSEVWNEKEFSILLDNKWINGRFDRITIVKNNENIIEKAIILDYKLGTGTEIQKYRDTYSIQLELYKTALSKILSSPLNKIEAQLLLVKQAQVVHI